MMGIARRRSVQWLVVAIVLTTGCGQTAPVPDASVVGGTTSSAASASPSPTPSQSPDRTLPAGVTFTLVATHDFTETADFFYFCCYLDIDPDGHVVTAEAGRSEILHLDGSTVVRRWGEPGTGPGQFGFVRDPGNPESAIGGIDMLDDGSAYVVEAGNKRVQRFDPTGEPELMWGSEGSGDGEFLDPIQVAVAPSGEVFVVDDKRNDIQVFTKDGVYLRTIGRQGSGDGELSDTGAIRIAADGTLVNADFGNSRVQAWDGNGDFLWSLGSHGSGPSQFVEPQDVAFGPDGSLFVVDDTRVQVFDAERQLIGTWPDPPSPDHLASVMLDGDTLWVEAPYVDTLYEIRVTFADR